MIRTEQLLYLEQFRASTSFILQGLAAVCETGRQFVEPEVFMYFVEEGNVLGKVATWVQYEDDVPIGVFVLDIVTTSEECYGEFVIVYNTPKAKVLSILESLGIPK